MSRCIVVNDFDKRGYTGLYALSMKEEAVSLRFKT